VRSEEHEGPLGFEVAPLGPMVAVGAVGTRTARVWVRAPGQARIAVAIAPANDPEDGPHATVVQPIDPAADETVSFEIPGDAPGLDPLLPDRRYRVRIFTVEGRALGEARFTTAPEDPAERFAFAAASCHQPFDDRGGLVPKSVEMLEAACKVVDERDARFLLLLGDQIYADYPKKRSLFERFFAEVAPAGRKSVFECTRDEIRRLWQTRHRIWFGVDAFRRLQARISTHPILDDHEIRDNFGSAPEHATEKWQAIREGARDAFFDYQASRVMPTREASFHHGFVNGPVAVFVMDLRSERRADEGKIEVYSDRQLLDLARFLAENADRPVAAIVVSVPIAHVDGSVTAAAVLATGQASDVADRWSNPKALRARDRLLRLIRAHQRAHPAQRIVLVGGDVHVGCLFEIAWDDGLPPIFQFTSSALSNVQPRVERWAAEQVPRTMAEIADAPDLAAKVRLVPSVDDRGANPFGDLNLGIVEIETGAQTRLRFLLHGPPEDGISPVVYDSGPL
jgi:alkaline phosphatase D